jgi:hypothetical protein
MDLKLVVLEQPYLAWNRPGVPELFQKVISLKKSGYGPEYPENVIPLDQSDFFGTHLLVCTEAEGGLIPVAGYKATSLSRCRKHDFEFPSITNLKSSGVDHLIPALQQIIANCDDISHDNAWTMNPSIRNDKELVSRVKAAFTTLGVFYHAELGTKEWITCGVKRFKTNDFFSWLGLREITPEFRLKCSAGEPVVMMHFKDISEEARAIVQANRKLWNECLVIAPAPDQVRKTAA